MHPRSIPLILTAFLLVCTVVVGQQKALTNEDIVRMIEAQLGGDVILSMIAQSPCDFRTDVDSILQLKEKGVPADVLQAMVMKGSTKARADAAAATDSPSGVAAADDEAPLSLPEEGVYYTEPSSGELVFMEPEVVTWKTGGFWKRVGTAGLNKGHVNGIVQGSSGRYEFAGSREVYIYCSQGTSASEFQLLKLWEKDDRRTFRAVTGGIVHSSSGADENAVPFEPERVAPRVYRVQLPNLPEGEYGLLPPAIGSAQNSPTIGKIYSFRITR